MELPKMIGRYRVRSLLGGGGFAQVFHADHPEIPGGVAVKVLQSRWASNDEINERFLAEARILASLSNRQVVNVLDLDEDELGRPFIVTEYADRGTLAGRISELRVNGQAPTIDEVVLVAEHLTDAVSSIHAEQIVHRDIKPANVLLRSTDELHASAGLGQLIRRDERLVLADFGFAKDLALHSGFTIGGGTAGYMAPEQHQKFGNVDHRADVYACTATIVELLLGVPPDAARRRLLDHPEGATPILASPLTDFIESSMAEDPDDRPATITEWLADLQAAIASSETLSSALAPWRNAVENEPSMSRSRGPIVALTAATAVVALGLTAALRLWPSEDSTKPVPRPNAATVGLSVDGPAAVLVGEEATWTVAASDAMTDIEVVELGLAGETADASSITTQFDTQGRHVLDIGFRAGTSNDVSEATHAIYAIADEPNAIPDSLPLACRLISAAEVSDFLGGLPIQTSFQNSNCVYSYPSTHGAQIVIGLGTAQGNTSSPDDIVAQNPELFEPVQDALEPIQVDGHPGIIFNLGPAAVLSVATRSFVATVTITNGSINTGPMAIEIASLVLSRIDQPLDIYAMASVESPIPPPAFRIRGPRKIRVGERSWFYTDVSAGAETQITMPDGQTLSGPAVWFEPDQAGAQVISVVVTEPGRGAIHLPYIIDIVDP